MLTATELGPDRPDADLSADTEPEPPRANRLGLSPRTLKIIRWTAIAVWALIVAYRTRRDGVAFDRNLLLVYICTGLFAATIGKRRSLTVIRDWLPFAIVLFAYDLTRGAAVLIGRPTEWHFQIGVDRWLFGGTEPTVWLQEKLKEPFPPWWEIGVSFVYVSFFFAPYVVAGLLWLRDRTAWKKFVVRFVAISFLGTIGFIGFPAAPPWAAAQCSAAQVADGPSDPACMDTVVGTTRDGGILGKVTPSHKGAAPYIERISTRGWNKIGLQQAKSLVDEGQAGVNQVAAIPSLHAAVSGLITVFFWPRVRKRFRPLLALYALAMAFSLVYSAEHYVFDILLGWLLTAVVTIVANRWDARRDRARGNQVGTPDTLEASQPT